MSYGKLCARCHRQKSSSQRNRKYCFHCQVAVKRETRERAHESRVQEQYGLRPGEYNKLYEHQGRKCAVKSCRARGVKKHLSVDHNHQHGLHNRRAVRGLLCSLHNDWIGKAGDDPEVFESIADYLRNPPARKVLTDEASSG